MSCDRSPLAVTSFIGLDLLYIVLDIEHGDYGNRIVSMLNINHLDPLDPGTCRLHQLRKYFLPLAYCAFSSLPVHHFREGGPHRKINISERGEM